MPHSKMPHSLEITRLGTGQTESLRALLHLFGEAFDEADSYHHHQPDDAWLESLLSDEDFIVLTAKYQGQISGGLCAYVLRKFEQRRKEIYIYDLAVAQKSRRKGVATALIDRVRDLAAQLGAWIIVVQAEFDNDGARALYRTMGPEETSCHYGIPPRR